MFDITYNCVLLIFWELKLIEQFLSYMCVLCCIYSLVYHELENVEYNLSIKTNHRWGHCSYGGDSHDKAGAQLAKWLRHWTLNHEIVGLSPGVRLNLLYLEYLGKICTRNVLRFTLP